MTFTQAQTLSGRRIRFRLMPADKCHTGIIFATKLVSGTRRWPTTLKILVINPIEGTSNGTSFPPLGTWATNRESGRKFTSAIRRIKLI